MTQYARRLVLGLLVLSSMAVIPALAQNQLSLIPEPNTLEIHEGEFVFPSVTPVYAFDEFSDVALLLSEHPYAHFTPVERIKSHKRIPENGVRLIRAREEDKLPADAYRLVVDTGGVTITAHQPAAIINGILTLLQLAYTQPDGRILPAMMIEDRPRFAYRGLHLDVSRHFYPLSFLKKFIDLMALYKFNMFHWHLTDGAGWRLEIKQYPELTRKAAWRTHVTWKDWWQNGRRYLNEGDPNASGGYYTQNEARELVAYAARKGITVIPEIEMPGHSDEVLAVYPELSCSGQAYQHAEFCIGNEESFTFLTNVLNEVADVFPSEYIHIGGDEAGKESWKTCPKCQALMEKEGLKTVDELQSYAVKRIDAFLKTKGKKLIGWDEILEGGIPEGATVMSWRGEEGGIQAANAGHNVIMTPNSHLYFDYYQSDPRTQPEAIGGYIPLRNVYEYEPIPAGVAADKVIHILGAQGNIWTEYMPTTEQVEYMAFPRALALAEVVWSDPKQRDWKDFNERLQQHYKLLQKFHVNYYRPSYRVDIAVHFNPDTLTNTVSMSTEQYGPGIRYTTDGKEPDAKSALYTEPIELSVPATVKAAYFVDSGRVGPVTMAKADVHKAIGKTVSYQTPWDTYAAEETRTLVNGSKGGQRADDGQWQGFRNNVDVTVDFERREELHRVAVDFLQDRAVNGYLPGEVKVLLSDNGKNFREAGTLVNDISPEERFPVSKTFEFQFDSPQTARYLRIVATNVQHELLLTDEVVVY
ncbi:beta-N-acetylhexosaminidase [Parapedobacter defluvii]|uniref:beta-N-acetylhexosaminidase n=1 Tax=Parapedobacter defluvii TaxID=2045106 RepID=A0ABQ1LYU0_9SPHI|nr:family 20 glycosylhydrolase [Parapedobacter defluvii]GGC32004.1 beta-N-acetylhexosaminidase [Parapedobacter defluvii]